MYHEDIALRSSNSYELNHEATELGSMISSSQLMLENLKSHCATHIRAIRLVKIWSISDSINFFGEIFSSKSYCPSNCCLKLVRQTVDACMLCWFRECDLLVLDGFSSNKYIVTIRIYIGHQVDFDH